jgi:hypothetical protein
MPFDGLANVPPINPAVFAYRDLVAARRLIRRRWNWTQGMNVRKGWFGNVSYCAAGALQTVRANRLAYETLQFAMQQRRPRIENIETYNDSASHHSVLRAFDTAIRRLAPL